MNYKRYFLTSESVTEEHPDKVCDLISDSILDACLEQDENSRVSVETMLLKDKVIVAGKIKSNAIVDIEGIVRKVLKEVGYTDKETNMDYATCEVNININKQSDNMEIEKNISEASDIGIMFGYATDESEDYMPVPISIAHKLSKRLSEIKKSGEITYLKSVGKVQVTIEYLNDFPFRIDMISIIAQHSKDVDLKVLQKDILEKVIAKVVDSDMIDIETKIFINSNRKFIEGSLIADTGLTGRKIISDTYGGCSKHGGGVFSGKDATKLERSVSYMLRHIAKNIVANGLARKCEIQMSYVSGLIEPLSVYIDCFGTNTLPEGLIIKIIKERFDLTPQGIIEYLKLKEPIYSKTTNYGHFGRNGFTWEKLVQI